MKLLLIILCLCAILSTCKSGRIVENDSEEITSTIASNAFDQRGLPIFPKHQEFIVKPTPNSNKEDFSKEMISTRKPLMARIVPKLQQYNIQYKEVTRKPLMKLRSFTIKMRSKDEDKRNAINHSKISFSDVDDRAENKTDKLDKINANRSFFKEEEQDRSEFIFLEKTTKIGLSDLVNVTNDYETTTNAMKLSIRRKRNSNIIVEENMGTTASPLKYTGQDSRLTNELYFKNINH